jgi:gliding motility-associated-like protein
MADGPDRLRFEVFWPQWAGNLATFIILPCLNFIQMKKKLLSLLLMIMGYFSYAQYACPNITGPVNGEVNVPVDSEIAWNAVAGADGYFLSLGTTMGGTELLDGLSTSATSYSPPAGLPENTRIFVTITLFFFDADNFACPSESFITEDVTVPPICTDLILPSDGAIDVNVNTAIGWAYAPRANGYRLSLGTSPGGSELLTDEILDNVQSYRPTVALPFETQIYVRMVPFNENGPAAGPCTEFSFRTAAALAIPGCTALISPADGAVNVPLTPILEWSPSPGAAAYRVSLGTAPGLNNILDNASFATTATPVIDFQPNRTFFVTIVPYNDAGSAIGCIQTSFTTTLGCGPYVDSVTGELLSLRPAMDFPDQVYLCRNQDLTLIQSEDTADGYRWFEVGPDGVETLISETDQVAIALEGTYRYEAYNRFEQSGNTLECAVGKEFQVFSSELPIIVALDVEEQNNGLRISVQTAGIGNYEYALDDPSGPYQASNVFENVATNVTKVYVRDKNGCGFAEQRIIQGPVKEDFPTFFTPNGDNVNDYWQFVPRAESSAATLAIIYIYDQFGNLVTQLFPNSKGWDGTQNGRPLPSSDYWFRAISTKNEKIVGHFTLKR